MHFARFDGTIATVRGDWEHFTPYADQAGAVGIVTEIRAGLTEIDKATYLDEKDEILHHNATIPVPAPKGDLELDAIRGLLAKKDADIADSEVKSIVLFIGRRLEKRGRLA